MVEKANDVKDFGDASRRYSATSLRTGPNRQAANPSHTGTASESATHEIDRANLRLGTNNMLARWIEYGSQHMPEYAPAQRTVDHFNGSGHTVEA